MIDSELVPWGKGEKQAGEADEIVSETICLQGTEARTVLRTGIFNYQFSIFIKFSMIQFSLEIGN